MNTSFYNFTNTVFFATTERVVAFYSYKAEREDELSIEPNDVIRVLSKPDTTWWRGHNTRTNAIGLYPSNHAQPANSTTNNANANCKFLSSYLLNPFNLFHDEGKIDSVGKKISARACPAFLFIFLYRIFYCFSTIPH